MHKLSYLISGYASKIRILKKSAVPSQFSWNIQPSASAVARIKRSAARSTNAHSTAETSQLKSADGDIVEDINDDLMIAANESVALVASEMQSSDFLNYPSSSNAYTQTDSSFPSTLQTNDNPDTVNICASPQDILQSPKLIKYFTGLEDYNIFCAVLQSLGPAAYELTYMGLTRSKLSVPDQLLLTLIKLRTYRPNFELALMFKVTEKEVYYTVVTWIRFLSLQWREINIWPTKESVKFFAPFDFRDKFPETRIIVDGLENPIKKPKSATAQQVTFSAYKNRNTAKTVVGITPGGFCCLISQAYGGSTSDRQIIERCGLIGLLSRGDHVMADKGFDVQDFFAPADVTVNIPTFFRKKNRLTGETVARDRKIASKRVHVERVIGSAKTYRILTQPLTHTEALLASDIIFICFMLVNFRRCIVPKFS